MFEKARMEAFSDGLFAVVLTIMVLDLKTGVEANGSWADITAPEVTNTFLAYVLSFAFGCLYWTNHTYLLHIAPHVTHAIMWTNSFVLFTLTLMPFCTRWMAQFPSATSPTCMYAILCTVTGASTLLLQVLVVKQLPEGDSAGQALSQDKRGPISGVLNMVAIPLALWSPWVARAALILVLAMWALPHNALEAAITAHDESGAASVNGHRLGDDAYSAIGMKPSPAASHRSG
jgi:uncharacterized membrane protein